MTGRDMGWALLALAASEFMLSVVFDWSFYIPTILTLVGAFLVILDGDGGGGFGGRNRVLVQGEM